MSILDDKHAYMEALKKAQEEFPRRDHYERRPEDCDHNFNFIIFCDGGDWDIARCPHCGEETIVRCTFDDDYD